MSWLLDTNAVSEPTRARPDPRYTAWSLSQPRGTTKLSAITVGELRRGALRLPHGDRRERLEAWLSGLLNDLGPGILPVTTAIAEVWAAINLRHLALGRQIGLPDEFIAATAIVHDLTVVTRNVRDFEHAGCKVLSPWSA